jgi:hypothetical protein
VEQGLSSDGLVERKGCEWRKGLIETFEEVKGSETRQDDRTEAAKVVCLLEGREFPAFQGQHRVFGRILGVIVDSFIELSGAIAQGLKKSQPFNQGDSAFGKEDNIVTLVS